MVVTWLQSSPAVKTSSLPLASCAFFHYLCHLFYFCHSTARLNERQIARDLRPFSSHSSFLVAFILDDDELLLSLWPRLILSRFVSSMRRTSDGFCPTPAAAGIVCVAWLSNHAIWFKQRAMATSGEEKIALISFYSHCGR